MLGQWMILAGIAGFAMVFFSRWSRCPWSSTRRGEGGAVRHGRSTAMRWWKRKACSAAALTQVA
jgi:hypothetical protein